MIDGPRPSTNVLRRLLVLVYGRKTDDVQVIFKVKLINPQIARIRAKGGRRPPISNLEIKETTTMSHEMLDVVLIVHVLLVTSSSQITRHTVASCSTLCTITKSIIMRLLTHNFLQSNVRGTTKGYPLKIVPSKILVEESPVDTELVRKMLPKLQYSAIVSAVAEITEHADPKPPVIPDELPEDGEVEEAVLEALHQVLFNIHVLEGELICPDTGRKFPIKQGIPNMILHEDEI
jgi:multifunctional methyltransferase subunit TRM112